MESGTIAAAARRAVDAPTLTEALRRTAANNPEIVAVRTPDDSVSLTWAELLERVDAVAGGLAKLGVASGDTVAIMLGNRPEFHIVDLAAVTVGATPFSIYVTYPAQEIEYLITDSGAKVAIVEQAFLPVVLEARKNLPALEHLIVVDGEAPAGTISLAEVEGSNGPPQRGPALPPQHHVHGQVDRGDHRARARRPRGLLAALGAHRRAQRAPLHTDRLRVHDHLCA